MTSPLLNRLTEELNWRQVDDDAALAAYLAEPGCHCLFLPGDPVKNLETNDAAVVLPELVAAFQGRFDVALVGPEIDRAVRELHDVWPSPSLVFFDGVKPLGSIKRIRNWDEYLRRITLMLDGGSAAAAE